MLYFTQPRTKPSSSTELTLPGEQSPRRHRRRPVPQTASAERRNLFPRLASILGFICVVDQSHDGLNAENFTKGF
ncbi:unnamed protein product [Camellia sinensis]